MWMLCAAVAWIAPRRSDKIPHCHCAAQWGVHVFCIPAFSNTTSALQIRNCAFALLLKVVTQWAWNLWLPAFHPVLRDFPPCSLFSVVWFCDLRLPRVFTTKTSVAELFLAWMKVYLLKLSQCLFVFYLSAFFIALCCCCCFFYF